MQWSVLGGGFSSHECLLALPGLPPARPGPPAHLPAEGDGELVVWHGRAVRLVEACARGGKMKRKRGGGGGGMMGGNEYGCSTRARVRRPVERASSSTMQHAAPCSTRQHELIHARVARKKSPKKCRAWASLLKQSANRPKSGGGGAGPNSSKQSAPFITSRILETSQEKPRSRLCVRPSCHHARERGSTARQQRHRTDDEMLFRKHTSNTNVPQTY
eukprot:SAG22_NODE_2210_length_2832_cov_16.291621_3_plen_217_part_00